MKTLTAALVAAVVAAGASAPTAGAHYYAGCKEKPCKQHVLRPFKASFLAPVGKCESGAGYSLLSGLRALSPGGTYRGRYQFDWASWRAAGGVGDPAAATWYEQAYRAVVGLHRNGRDSWPNC